MSMYNPEFLVFAEHSAHFRTLHVNVALATCTSNFGIHSTTTFSSTHLTPTHPSGQVCRQHRPVMASSNDVRDMLGLGAAGDKASKPPPLKKQKSSHKPLRTRPQHLTLNDTYISEY